MTKNETLLMPPDEAMSYLIETGKMSLKLSDDYVPTVVTQNLDGEIIVAVLALNDPHEGLTAALSAHMNEPIYFTSFTADSYKASWSVERLEAEKAKGRISLREHFEAGDPQVHETLMITAVFLDGEHTKVRSAWLPYRRTDTDIVWLEPDQHEEEVQGRTVSTLRLAVEISNRINPFKATT